MFRFIINLIVLVFVGAPAAIAPPPRSPRRVAVIYVRKSKVKRPEPVKDVNGNPVLDAQGRVVMTAPRMISPEVQLAETKELAQRFGYTTDDIVVLSDLSISGRKGRDKRPDYDKLLTMIENNEVEVVFSYSLSRLSRKVADILDLVHLCAQHGVAIHLARDPDPDPTNATSKLLITVLAAFASWEAEITSERMIDVAEARRRRGDHLGGKFFDQPEKVRDAFLQAGSYREAARTLARWGIKTRNGRAVWAAEAVKSILRREYPELAPAHPSQGAPTRRPYVFYRLIKCHCGRVMTGRRDKRKPSGSLGAIRYICLQGLTNPFHGGGGYIAEPVVMEAVKQELRHFRMPFDAVGEQQAEADKARLAELRDERDRLGILVARGRLSEEAAAQEQDVVDAEIAQIELAGRVIQLDPAIPWDDAEAANEHLQLIFEEVRVTPEMEVGEIVWRLPRFRAEDVA